MKVAQVTGWVRDDRGRAELACVRSGYLGQTLAIEAAPCSQLGHDHP
jgi:hypothetical protein